VLQLYSIFTSWMPVCCYGLLIFFCRTYKYDINKFYTYKRRLPYIIITKTSKILFSLYCNSMKIYCSTPYAYIESNNLTIYSYRRKKNAHNHVSTKKLFYSMSTLTRSPQCTRVPYSKQCIISLTMEKKWNLKLHYMHSTIDR
jgi:hypothetical protein